MILTLTPTWLFRDVRVSTFVSLPGSYTGVVDNLEYQAFFFRGG